MKKLFIIAAAALLQACAFTDAQLDIQANPDSNIVGPLSEVSSIQFKLPEMADSRDDKQRIGWKKNGYGQNTADITSILPVEDIVEGALVEAIKDNGHESVIDSGKISITGTVDRFWFETDMNFWTVEFIGDINCTLEFTNTETQELIYKSSYSGSHKEKVAGGLEKTWTKVMNMALDKLIEDVVFDEELVEALEEFSGE